MQQLFKSHRHKILLKGIRPLGSLTLIGVMTVASPGLALDKLATAPAIATLANNKSNSPEVAYTLGAGDRIRIEIFKLPQYSGEQEILINGSINLPQVGSVSVGNLTLEGAAKAIAAKYASARVLRNPQVTVSLLQPRPVKIGIAGEINRPGSYTIPIKDAQTPTLTQALQLAGGITQAADLRQVKVNRLRPGGSRSAIAIDLWQLLRTGDLSNDLPLRDGDTIFIPATAQIDLTESPQLATTSFSTDRTEPINIAVLGEVRQPGTHAIAPQEGGSGLTTTVTQAIKVAGGINPLADIHKVEIRRLTKTGSFQRIEINLAQLLGDGDLKQDLILQNGDTVIVPIVENIDLAEASRLRTVSFAPDKTQPLNVTVTGEVFRPGPYTVTGTARTGEAGVPGGAGGADTAPTVTRAIQVAGGIKPLANIRKIQIRRFTSTGEERILAIDLWKLLQQGDSTQDAILQDGDTIVVPQAPTLPPEEAAQVAAASFSPDTINVNIVGEVPNPGVVQIPPNTPLNQALFSAGGFTNRAKKSSVELVRINPNGTVSRRKIELDFAVGVSEEVNPVLYNNDVIIVDRSTLAGISDTLDTALNPLGKFLTIFSLPFSVFNLFN